MKRIVLELDDNHADILSVTAIGVGGTTKVATSSFDIREITTISLETDGDDLIWHQK